jgi:hypothetical protein
VVSVLAIGPKVRGFKPGRGRLNFEGYKSPQHLCEMEVKPSAACYKILRNVKNPSKYERDTETKFVISFASSCCFATR